MIAAGASDNDPGGVPVAAATGIAKITHALASTLGDNKTATWPQIQAVRVAVVTRSEKCETDPVTPGPLAMFCSPKPCAASMTLTSDQQHLRYKVLETIAPLRNVAWTLP